MLNDRIRSIPNLQSALVEAEDFLSEMAPVTPHLEFESE